MNLERFVARAAYVVDKALRKQFPIDFNIRCLFASAGMNLLAQREGFTSHVIGGTFYAVTATIDWTDIDGHLVDLGLMYLSVGYTPARCESPISMWPLTKPLPEWLEYRREARFAASIGCSWRRILPRMSRTS